MVSVPTFFSWPALGLLQFIKFPLTWIKTFKLKSINPGVFILNNFACPYYNIVFKNGELPIS